jgi:hypothetical protein
MDTRDRICSFADFWPQYVLEHQSVGCRALHFVGTSLAIACVATVLVTGSYRWLMLAPLLGYGLSWIGHMAVERNRPTAFRYPGWSFAADLKMWGLIICRQMAGEVRRVSAENAQASTQVSLRLRPAPAVEQTKLRRAS